MIAHRLARFLHGSPNRPTVAARTQEAKADYPARVDSQVTVMPQLRDRDESKVTGHGDREITTDATPA